MKARTRQILFSAITLSVFVFSLVLPSAALADDGAPPPETPVVETQAPEAPSAEETQAPETSPAVETQAPEAPPALQEVLEQAPPDTQVVVVNDAGQVEPLATTEAAEILLTGDPMWCPGSSLPGSAGCTPPQGSMGNLIAVLDGDATYSGAGTIWIESTYDGTADGSSVTIDQEAAYNLSYLTDLTLQGYQANASDPAVTTIKVPLTINWLYNVTLNNLFIDADDPYAALVVDSLGDITLDDVAVNANLTGTGALLDTCQGNNGLCEGTGSITITDSTFDDNGFNGLVTVSAGDTTLTNVTADNNNANGAFITGVDDDGTGDVIVTDSTFSGNGNGTGVDVLSDGSVTLTNVTANDNRYGANLDTTPGTGDILINGGHYNSNVYDGLDGLSAGNITVNNSDISSNLAYGAYLDSTYGDGFILVDNSTFASNGTSTYNDDYGLLAVADTNVLLTNLNVDGGGVTDFGAMVGSINGIVSVQDSTFTKNTGTGLLIASGDQVDLVSLTVTANLGDGAQVYSTYTYACFGKKGILVNVDSGTYGDNGGAGLFVMPGPEGTVVVGTPPIFTPANGTGDLVVDLGDPCQSGKDEEKPEEGKGPKVVDVPFKGGEPVEQDCLNYSSTILQLPDGTWVKFGCPFEGFTALEGLNENELPDTLGAGADFVAGLLAKMINLENAEITFNKDGTITITFQIPEDSNARGYDILYWDPTANNGTGAWVTLPQSKFGQRLTPLNPGDPEDGRMIKRGVLQKGDTVSVTVNFTGIFVLVSR